MNRENSPLRANRETAGKQYGAAMVLLNQQAMAYGATALSLLCVRAFVLKSAWVFDCLFVCVCLCVFARCAMAFALLLRREHGIA